MPDEESMTIAGVSAPPARFNFAQHLFEINAGRDSKVAFIGDTGELTYGALRDAAQRVATGMRELGIRREERVLLLMHDAIDWPVAFLGCIYAGVVPVAVSTLATAEDYAFMLDDSRAQAVLVSDALRGVLDSALSLGRHEVRHTIVSTSETGLRNDRLTLGSLLEAPRMADSAPTLADECAFWLYSSGSTGAPKATVHSHANPYWTAELYGKRVLGIETDDVCFSAAKLFFAYGLGNALTFPMSVGATSILMAERPTPDAVFRRWRGEIGGVRPTVFYGAPTGYAGMLAAPDLPSPADVTLRLASSAGEALPAELGENFSRHFGIDVIDGIGSTEMLHIYLSNRPGEVRFGSTGFPVPGYDIELRDHDGAPVPDGDIGDLYVRGPSSAIMYWNNREKTRDTFLGDWTRTGDKYVRNADGSYTYGGRNDDMIKVSGIYVSPFEVEATLVRHPAVLEAAVIGVPDADGLVKTKAFVVTKEGGVGRYRDAPVICEGSPGTVQIPALDRVRRSAT